MSAPTAAMLATYLRWALDELDAYDRLLERIKVEADIPGVHPPGPKYLEVKAMGRQLVADTPLAAFKRSSA